MVWEIVENRQGLPWAQWADLEAFALWQSRLRLLWSLPVSRYPDAVYTAQSDPDAYVRLGIPSEPAFAVQIPSYRGLERWSSSREDFYAAQAGFARAVLECIGNMLRALNQPAFACPSYVAAYRGRFGSRDPASGLWVGGVLRQDAANFIDGLWPRAARSWEGDGAGYSVEIFPRLVLKADSTVDDQFLFARMPPDPPAQGPFSPGPDRGCEGVTAPLISTEQCASIRWPPDGGAERMGSATLLISLDRNWELLNALVGDFTTRTAREFINRSRQYVVLKNIRNARRWGGSVPEDLATAAAAAEEFAASESATTSGFRTVMGDIGTIVSGLNPLIGAAVKGLGEIPALLETLGGRAVGQELDEFGRVEPVYETAALGGVVQVGTVTRPPFVVAPPSVVDVLRFPLLSPRGEPWELVPRVELEASGGSGSAPVPGSLVAVARRLWGA
jgi:hypothetical protein